MPSGSTHTAAPQKPQSPPAFYLNSLSFPGFCGKNAPSYFSDAPLALFVAAGGADRQGGLFQPEVMERPPVSAVSSPIPRQAATSPDRSAGGFMISLR